MKNKPDYTFLFVLFFWMIAQWLLVLISLYFKLFGTAWFFATLMYVVKQFLKEEAAAIKEKREKCDA